MAAVSVCRSAKPRNRPSFRHILMHLDIAAHDWLQLPENDFYQLQVSKTDMKITSPPGEVKSIVMSMSVCLFVCLFTCITRKPHRGVYDLKFELTLDFLTVHLPTKFYHPMFNCAKVIMLTDKQSHTQTTQFC